MSIARDDMDLFNHVSRNDLYVWEQKYKRLRALI
jgi:hypothetical protein